MTERAVCASTASGSAADGNFWRSLPFWKKRLDMEEQMYHFFVRQENIGENTIVLDGADVNHIKNVLRMRPGEEVLLSSGDNCDFLCEIQEITSTQVAARIVKKEERSCELPCKITLFQGLPKAGKMELIIQKAVELGVYEIVPVAMKRCVVKLDEKKSVQKCRHWNGIAESAAKQSRRSRIPRVAPVMSYQEAVSYAGNLDVVLFPYECAQGMEAAKKLVERIVPGQSVGIFIGPEGGYDLSELQMGRDANFCEMTLGRRILRTETAGMMLLSVLSFHLED